MTGDGDLSADFLPLSASSSSGVGGFVVKVIALSSDELGEESGGELVEFLDVAVGEDAEDDGNMESSDAIPSSSSADDRFSSRLVDKFVTFGVDVGDKLPVVEQNAAAITSCDQSPPGI